MPVNIPKLSDPLIPWFDREGKPTTDHYHYMFMLDAYIRDVDARLAILSGDVAGAPNPLESLEIAVSDEVTALAAGTAKITFRMPYAFTLEAGSAGIRASLKTAQTSGNIFTVDINEAGSTILSTKLTIDNTEKTSTTAATPTVISDTTLADDAEMTVDIDQIGDGTAKGLKIILIGRRT